MKGLELLVFERSAAGIGDPDVGHAGKCLLIGDSPCIRSGTSGCRDPSAIAGAAGNPDRGPLHDAKHIGMQAAPRASPPLVSRILHVHPTEARFETMPQA